MSNIIHLAHKRANQLSLKEIEMVSAENLESGIIQQMSLEIFREVSKLPDPQMT